MSQAPQKSQATQKLLIQLLKKIPIFDGLPPTQVRQLLGICQPKPLDTGERLCTSDTPSDEMYILLTGQLDVTTAEGLWVATILPVTTVGEMGVITGQPRAATVEVIKAAKILAIQKPRFDALLQADQDICSRIFRNVIHILAEKLVNDNIHLRDFQVEKDRFAGRLTSLESQIDLQEKRLEILLDFVEERDFMARSELEQHVQKKVLETAARILIVDDEPEFRQLVVDALPFFAVIEAGNGHEALNAIEEKQPDLVITDIKMPEMDGLALLDAVRSQHPELPVLAVSGYVDAYELEDRGFNGIIHKPLKLKAFRELIERALNLEE